MTQTQRPGTGKVFCIGLPKSGTTTFGDCMKHLGYRHRCGPIEEGAAIVQIGRSEILEDIIVRWDSFDDTPWPFLFEHLSQAYPGARFVLTRRRNSQVWMESLIKHSRRIGATNALQMTFGHYELTNHEEEMIALHDTHLEKVRNHFAGAENFCELCWEEGDGWAELCGFLGKPVPETPFPRSNTADALTPAQLVQAMCEKGRLAAAVAYARDHQEAEALTDVIEAYLRGRLKRTYGLRKLKKLLS